MLPHVASFHITSHCLMTIFRQNTLCQTVIWTALSTAKNFSTLGDEIYHGQLVTDQFCDLILDRVKQHTRDLYKQANSMHQEAILIDQLGLGPLIEAFSGNFFIKDISQVLPDVYLPPLDGIHSYIVRYSKSLDHDLGFHVDDSFLTINLCLNDSLRALNWCLKELDVPVISKRPPLTSAHASITKKATSSFTMAKTGIM